MPIGPNRTPGQPFRPRAGEWNAMLDAARANRGDELSADADRSDVDWRLTRGLARNVGATDLPQFAAVPLGDPIIGPDEGLGSFQNQPAFDVDVATDDTVEDPAGILLAPIAAATETRQRIGDIALAGVVPCLVDMITDGDRFAGLTSGQTYLTSGAAGPFEILAVDDGVGQKWAIVRFGGVPDSGTAVGLATAFVDKLTGLLPGSGPVNLEYRDPDSGDLTVDSDVTAYSICAAKLPTGEQYSLVQDTRGEWFVVPRGISMTPSEDGEEGEIEWQTLSLDLWSETFNIETTEEGLSTVKVWWADDALIEAVKSAAAEGTSERLARADHVHALNVDCGLEWTDNTLSVNRASLMGAGLKAGSGTCDMELDVTCGLQFDGNHLEINRADLMGAGLKAGDSTCDMQAALGCGLTLDGNNIVVNPGDLAGCGLTRGDAGCQIKFDPTQVVGFGLAAGTGCTMEVDPDSLFGVDGIAGCGLLWDADDGFLLIDRPALMGAGLKAGVGDCDIQADLGAGLEFDGNHIAVALYDEGGLEFSLDDELRIKTGCGVATDADGLRFKPSDVIEAGSGLTYSEMDACSIAVQSANDVATSFVADEIDFTLCNDDLKITRTRTTYTPQVNDKGVWLGNLDTDVVTQTFCLRVNSGTITSP